MGERDWDTRRGGPGFYLGTNGCSAGDFNLMPPGGKGEENATWEKIVEKGLGGS